MARLTTILLLHLPMVLSGIDNDNCALVGFLPFSSDLASNHNAPATAFNSTKQNIYLVGLSHTIAAYLALRDFNRKDTRIVPELEKFKGCSVKLDLNASVLIQSGELSHEAIQAIWKQNADEPPCAVVGPYWDLPAAEIAVAATARQIPMMAYRIFNDRLVNPYHRPFTTSVFPSPQEWLGPVASFLESLGASPFLNFLYPLTDGRITMWGFLVQGLRNKGFVVHERKYRPSSSRCGPGDNTILSVLKNVKATPFETILVAPEFSIVDIPAIANKAAKIGLLDDDNRIWVWIGPLESDFDLYGQNENVKRLLAGSIWLTPMENIDNGAYLSAWRNLTDSDMEQIQQWKSRSGLFDDADREALRSLVQHRVPHSGSGFMYDAIMAIGMGACLAQNITSPHRHIDGIRSAMFHGATSRVSFGGKKYCVDPGERSSIPFTASSIVIRKHAADNSTYLHKNVAAKQMNGKWIRLQELAFRDGSHKPPPQYQPPRNYLSSKARITGLSFMSLGLVIAFTLLFWIYFNRGHPTIKAAQPEFLSVLVLGSIISLLAILTISLDESSSSEVKMGRACMSTLWLSCLGFVITYGALFSKMWRIDQLLHHSRRKILARDVAWPVAVFCSCAILILSIWTAIDPLVYVRTVIDSSTGESLGRCQCEHFAAFISPLVLVMMVPLIMTAVMAYKTKDIADAYSESTWIFLLIVVQFEVAVIGIPVQVLLRDTEPVVRYVALSVMLWVFPMSTMLLVIGPKFIAHKRAVWGSNKQTARGGPTGQVRVSGLFPLSGGTSHANIFETSARSSDLSSHNLTTRGNKHAEVIQKVLEVPTASDQISQTNRHLAVAKGPETLSSNAVSVHP